MTTNTTKITTKALEDKIAQDVTPREIASLPVPSVGRIFHKIAHQGGDKELGQIPCIVDYVGTIEVDNKGTMQDVVLFHSVKTTKNEDGKRVCRDKKTLKVIDPDDDYNFTMIPVSAFLEGNGTGNDTGHYTSKGEYKTNPGGNYTLSAKAKTITLQSGTKKFTYKF